MNHRDERIHNLFMLSARYGISLNNDDIRLILEIIDKDQKACGSKVEMVKKAMADGSYRVPGNKVAMDMLKESLTNDYLLNHDISQNLLSYLLAKIPAGKDHSSLFHKLCSIFVSDVFKQDLSYPHLEKRGSKGHKRFDLVLYNKATKGFWNDMKLIHKITHVVFEFKNWKHNDNREFIGQIARYADNNRAIVLVTREKPNESLLSELAGIFRKTTDFLPLSISVDDLKNAADISPKESSPSEIFANQYIDLQFA